MPWNSIVGLCKSCGRLDFLLGDVSGGRCVVTGGTAVDPIRRRTCPTQASTAELPIPRLAD